jgi:transposase
LALAEIYDGGSRTKAARIGGVGLQSVRDWVVRFNAHGPDGLIDGKAPGNSRKLNDSHRQALVNIVESGPMLELFKKASRPNWRRSGRASRTAPP